MDITVPTSKPGTFSKLRSGAVLRKNIEAVVKWHIRHADTPSAPITQQKPHSTTLAQSAADRSQDKPSKQRGHLIESIASRLPPPNLRPNDTARVLRVDVKGLKRKRDACHTDDVGPRISGGEPDGKRPREGHTRCKCELTIWYTRRSPNGLHSREVQLLRDSQQCTVRTATDQSDDDSVAIDLDQAFHIPSTKLVVPAQRGVLAEPSLAESYSAQIVIQPFVIHDEGDEWPPIPLPTLAPLGQRLGSGKLIESERLLHLVAKFHGLPSPTLPDQTLNVTVLVDHGQPKLGTDFGLEVEALWSAPHQQSTKLLSSSDRLPTPVSEPDVRRASEPTVAYHLSNWVYVRKGFRCLLCRAEDWPISSFEVLRFHLMTEHNDYHSHETLAIAKGSPEHHNTTHTIHLRKIRGSKRSNDGSRQDEWSWLKPTKRKFNLSSYLAGDRSWITGQNLSAAEVSEVSHQRIDDQLAIPSAFKVPATNTKEQSNPHRKRFPVPPLPPGGAYFRTLTKRPLEPGELLSESDEEVDDSWLRQKHIETIDDFTDVTPAEKEFIKRWDGFMFDEKSLANRYLPAALMKFVEGNKAWLVRREMAVEFVKHATRLVLYGIIDERVVFNCVDVIRRAASNDLPLAS
ncbi:MAG: hypothetical protein M1817_004715 [Caeruleum heppii]|nr:MAG: hypothetical protein M1817_004715 [Caeruleum heppii]